MYHTSHNIQHASHNVFHILSSEFINNININIKSCDLTTGHHWSCFFWVFHGLPMLSGQSPRLFGFNRHDLTSSAVLSDQQLLEDVQLLKDVERSFHWLGLRENLEEAMVLTWGDHCFPHFSMVFQMRNMRKPWFSPWNWAGCAVNLSLIPWTCVKDERCVERVSLGGLGLGSYFEWLLGFGRGN